MARSSNTGLTIKSNQAFSRFVHETNYEACGSDKPIFKETFWAKSGSAVGCLCYRLHIAVLENISYCAIAPFSVNIDIDFNISKTLLLLENFMEPEENELPQFFRFPLLGTKEKIKTLVIQHS